MKFKNSKGAVRGSNGDDDGGEWQVANKNKRLRKSTGLVGLLNLKLKHKLYAEYQKINSRPCLWTIRLKTGLNV